MNPFKISIKRLDGLASEYAERFMNIDSYKPHFDKFYSLITTNKPKILELVCGTDLIMIGKIY